MYAHLLKEEHWLILAQTTHIYLYAIQNDLCTKVIAGEVIQGPYKAAKRNIANYELNQQVDVRLGDGLSVINSEDQIDNITVCGMGGPLIAKY